MQFPVESARALIRGALDEDLGRRGDLTTQAIFPDGRVMRGLLVARERVVVAGLPAARLVCEELAARTDSSASVAVLAGEGDQASAGAALARIDGDALNILAGERVLLNVVARITGIATATRQAVDEVGGFSCRISDTRKTTPGLRALEKYAVAVGGGENHRGALDELILVKDNHKQLAGGIVPALAALARAGHSTDQIEIEVDSLDELRSALDFGCGWVLLDNMSPEQAAEAVRLAAGRARIEASGGMVPGRLRPYAAAGVDRISMGYLTHSARAADLALDLADDHSSACSSR